VFEGDPSRASIYKDIGNGVPSAGIEYYLPLFFDETATLFHYLPQDAQLAFVGDMDAAIKRFTNDTRQRYNFLSHDRERPILEPQRLFLSDDDFFSFAKPFARLVCRPTPGGGWSRRCRISRSIVTPKIRSLALRHIWSDAESRAVRNRIRRPPRDDPATAGSDNRPAPSLER
jgi:hypothetical protein